MAVATVFLHTIWLLMGCPQQNFIASLLVICPSAAIKQKHLHYTTLYIIKQLVFSVRTNAGKERC
jgi:hypothetical protein